MLESSNSDDILRRRALYALSSAARGNPDVQSILLSMESPSKTKDKSELAENAMNNNRFAMILHDLTESYIVNGAAGVAETMDFPPSIELIRKIFAFVSDMLAEYQYLQEQIENPQGLDLSSFQINVGGGSMR